MEIDPKMLAAYGNLSATAILGLAFLVAMWLVARNFMKVLNMHVEEKTQIMDDHRNEREEDRTDRKQSERVMHQMQQNTIAAIHSFDKSVSRFADVISDVKCIKLDEKQVNFR